MDTLAGTGRLPALERAAGVLSGEIEAAGRSFAEGQLVVFSPGARIVPRAKRTGS
jgi:redox-sensitive bicupin YhaK (pirin superfamily)